MNSTFVSLLMLGARFVPGLNKLSFVRDYGSLSAGLKVLTKALGTIERAAENALKDATQLQSVIDSAAAAQKAAQEEAERAKRVAGRFNDLLA